MEVYYERELSQSDVESWSTARETGFSLLWWIEGDTGDKLEMEVEPRYLEENKIFRNWIKIFHHLTEMQNGEESTFSKIVNILKIDCIVIKNITANELPLPSQITAIIDYILEKQSVTNNTTLSDNHVITFSNETQWILGYNLFMIISSPIPSIPNLQQFYQYLMMKGHPWMIIHTLGNMMKEHEKVNFKKVFNVDTKEVFALVASDLYELMGKHYPLKLGKIKTLLAMRNISNVNEKESIKPDILDVSNHPVHIVNDERKLSPSAFIPFCQIGKEYLGMQVDNFSVPVCTGFQKKIFEGQICYSFNLTQFQESKVNKGRENALKLIVDVNSERDSLLTPPRPIDDSIKIHINTIKSFTAYGGGQYVITSVKQMSSSKDFNKFPDDMKKCQNKETIEECSNRKLIVEGVEQCGCLPPILNHLQHLIQVANIIRRLFVSFPTVIIGAHDPVNWKMEIRYWSPK